MALQDRLENEPLGISVHAVCELLAGAELSRERSAEHHRVLDFCAAIQVVYPDERFAPAYGRLLASLQRKGQTLGAMDLLIATAAIVDDAPLVTRNAKKFSRIAGLEVISY